ncbi:MAG: hypothetical protein ACK535_17430 [Cyanobacteriota bacterium]
MVNNFNEIFNGLRQEFLRKGGDFECCRNFRHALPEAARQDARNQASAALLQRLRLEKGLELRPEDLLVDHRAVLHWRQVSDDRLHAYPWNHRSFGTLPAAPTFVGFVYWLPKVPASGRDGDQGSSDARLDLMRQLLHSR